MQSLTSVRANAGQQVALRTQVARVSRTPTLQVTARAQKAGVGLLGTKAGMTTIFQENGDAVPCTIIALESANYVTQIFNHKEHGYDAVQVWFWFSCHFHMALFGSKLEATPIVFSSAYLFWN